VITDVNGQYLFSGLPQGTYIISVTPPSAYPSTTDAGAQSDTANPNLNIDNNDNGVGTAAGIATSNPVTINPGDAGSSNTVDDSTGTTTNPTLDFGFTVTFVKTLISTDLAGNANTSGTDVTIGEVLVYEISMTIPSGALDSIQLVDTPQAGLAFVDCISITMPGNVTSTMFGTGGTCDTSDGITAGVNNPLIENNGGRITFDFGTITNATSTSEVVRVRYSMIVLDILANQGGNTLTNNVVWSWAGSSKTTSAPPVKIVEPDLRIDKSALPTSATAGTAIEFTLTIAHTAQSSADAFDVAITDILPAGLEYITCTPISYSGLLPTIQPDPCLVTADGLSFVWDTFPLGEIVTIKFFARYTGAQQTLTNNASVAWSSLSLDPTGTPPLSVQLSAFNSRSTERWYDPLDLVNVYQVVGSVTINPVPVQEKSKIKWPKVLPATGFAPDRITTLSQQPADKLYSATDVRMEIPNIGINIPIVGVPLVNNDWDVSWLWQQAGWLNGTAFPGWQGNSVLTGHITLSNGKPGPFEEIDKLKWGDEIVVHAYGSVYTYMVRENRTITPNDTSVFQHEEQAWLTLLTCKTYSERTDTYSSRIAVRAVLLKVEQEKQLEGFNDNR
jgi:LPXTG-site transpeptidase (sortase) family protein